MAIIPVFHAYTDPEDRSPGESHTVNEAGRIRHLEGEVARLEAEVERLRQPIEVVVKLDTKAVVEAVVAALDGKCHVHRWHEYDGSYYCYGCKTFMPDKLARDTFVAEQGKR
jgi:hypothetical protein